MKRTMHFLVMAAIIGGAALAPALADTDGHRAEQLTCPVMEGNPIKESIYVDHQGERVYFCCDFCQGEFLKAPEKYLDKLPQFADAHPNVAGDAHGHEHDSPGTTTGWRLYRFTGPLGIATFSLLVLTLSTGLLRRKLKRRFLKIHKPLAFATGAVAMLHALTVLLGH